MKKLSPYMKMRVLSAIDYAPGKSIRDRLKAVSEQGFKDEEGEIHYFTWRTIQTWYYRFKVDGTTTMIPKKRSDIGKLRKISHEELQEAIDKVLPSFKKRGKSYNKTQVYRACIEKGLFSREQIARNTFSRLVKELELFKEVTDTINPKRLAFAKMYSNQLWQADTMFGPSVKHGSGYVQTKLIAFIDDASRVLIHGHFFPRENTHALMKVLQTGIYKRGIPEQIYVDNGSIYSGMELGNVCARIGCLLSHTKVRDGAAKGKIERFFRTVRDSFLIRKLDLASVETLNQQFSDWVENHYNNAIHSTIQMKPIDRFGLDLKRIRFLSPNELNDELFYVSEERTVSKTNTFSFGKIRHEAPRDLRDRKIEVRYDRFNKDRVIVFYKGQRMGIARVLDYHANDRKPEDKS